jgi:hypothetical protein
MEIVLAVIIGLAVASIVFVFGRILVGTSEPAPRRSELSNSGGSPDAVSVQAMHIQEAEPASSPAVLSESQEVTAPKKARKPSSARAEDTVKVARRPRRRKTGDATAPGSDVVQ